MTVAGYPAAIMFEKQNAIDVVLRLEVIHMIEFKGAYCRRPAEKSIAVTVQFDGVLLHVWHLSDPFCRLLSSDVFQLSAFPGKNRRCIKLPHGGRIETDDLNALAMLQKRHPSFFCNPILTFFSNWKAAIAIGVLLILAGAWSISKILFPA